MEIIITGKEKEILSCFIDCKIPILIKDNSYYYKHDLMECYEEMFNGAHSLIDGYMIRKSEIFCIFDKEFNLLLSLLNQNKDLMEFCNNAVNVIDIMKKYIYKD